MQYIRIGSKILFTNRIIFLLWSFTELPQGKVAELALWFMLEMKSVAKSIKYCALEYCAEKSTAKLVQFFSDQSKQENSTFQTFVLYKIWQIYSFFWPRFYHWSVLSLCFRRLTRWRWWTWWRSCCGRPSPPPSGPCHPSASSSYHRRCNIAWRLEQTFHISTLEP